MKETNLLTSILLGDEIFQRQAAKINEQCGLQNEAWSPDTVLEAAKRKNNLADPKTGSDFAPHFKVHIALSWHEEDRADRTSFGTLFSPHSRVQSISFFFKRNDAEAYVWPKSDTRQARQKLRSNLPNLTNLRKKNPKHKRLWSQTSHDKTKTYNMNYDMIKYWVASKAGFMHGDTWAKPGEASKPEFLHMARPKRGRARPTISQN